MSPTIKTIFTSIRQLPWNFIGFLFGLSLMFANVCLSKDIHHSLALLGSTFLAFIYFLRMAFTPESKTEEWPIKIRAIHNMNIRRRPSNPEECGMQLADCILQHPVEKWKQIQIDLGRVPAGILISPFATGILKRIREVQPKSDMSQLLLITWTADHDFQSDNVSNWIFNEVTLKPLF